VQSIAPRCDVLRYVHKLLQALQDLHFYNIVCGVLPAESVLLSYAGDLKVDVGFTPCLLGTLELRESAIRSTLVDAADCPPEFFGEGLLSKKADVWAAGCDPERARHACAHARWRARMRSHTHTHTHTHTHRLLLYRMLLGQPAFSHSNRYELLAAICDRPVNVPSDVSAEARLMLMCMLDKNPESRASVRYAQLIRNAALRLERSTTSCNTAHHLQQPACFPDSYTSGSAEFRTISYITARGVPFALACHSACFLCAGSLRGGAAGGTRTGLTRSRRRQQY
jgi:serine/threonine protein kinase